VPGSNTSVAFNSARGRMSAEERPGLDVMGSASPDSRSP
jgi:hypothetical protein